MARTVLTNFSSTGIDDNADALAITIDSSENVGIGTITPAYKLDVNGQINATSVTQNGVAIDPVKATQSKTYTNGEVSELTLSESITSGVPVVSVTKEIPQSGVSNNDWDVNSTTENYTRINSAPATTLDFGTGSIAGATFVDSFSVASQETASRSVKFNTDGTKMFITGNGSDAIHEYTLSTAFDVSTSTFSQSLSVLAQVTNPLGVVFNNDGTKMFVTSDTDKDISEYNLSTAFDISTATYSQAGSISATTGNARNATFNNDGTKIYVCDRANHTVDEYALSTAFDISTLSYTDDFDVSAQANSLTDVQFNSDGTKMFALSEFNNGIYRYSLSTAFDVSTASYDSVTLDVTSQESSPAGFVFGGVKLFVIGFNGNDVNEYTLPLTFSLGTGSFASADVGKTIEANSGVFVLTATDGSISTTTAPTSYNQVASGSWEMYAVVYNTTDGDLELSNSVTAFDISSGSYVQSFSVGSQDTKPNGLTFNTDGTKMFIIGSTGDAVYEYTLSTGFDLSTASYASKSFSVSSQEGFPTSVVFNTDGTKMFIIGIGTSYYVNEYALSTGFDISTASHSQFFATSSQDTSPTGLTFNNDGTKMFIVGNAGDDINEYTLTTGFDVSTASYSQNFSIASETTNPWGMEFNSDGTKMFVVGGAAADSVYEYTLTTGFDVSTASYSSNSFSVGSQDTDPKSIAFSADGTKMFIVGDTNNSVYEYNVVSLAIPSGYHAVHTTTSIDSQYWTDINSMTADEAAGNGAIYYTVSTDDRTTWKIAKGTDGERSIVRNNSGTWQYNSNGTYGSTTWSNAATNTELAALQEAMEGASVVTGFSITSASYDSKTFDPASQETNPRDIAFNSDGTKAYFIGVGADTVFQYSLSTAYDISTASYDSVSFSIAAQENEPQGLTFNSDGTKMFVVGTTGDDVNEYTLSTGFDVSTASYSQIFSVSAQDTAPSAIKFNSDGTKMFIAGSQNETIYQYTLTTGFDVSTASYASKSILVSSEESILQGLAFNNDGTKMFITGTNGDEINEYTLTTGFDLSTASFSSNLFSVSSQSGAPQSVTFNSDGTKMYITDNNGVFQYSSVSTSYPNQMNKTQLDAVPDANHFTLGNDLDLAIIFNMSSGTTVPSSDGVSINFDANSLNQGAILGTDYNWDFPASNKVRITSLAAQNLKVRIL